MGLIAPTVAVRCDRCAGVPVVTIPAVGTGWDTFTAHLPCWTSPSLGISKQADMEGKGTGLEAHIVALLQEALGEDFWIHFQLTQANLQVTENFLPSLTVSQGIDKT